MKMGVIGSMIIEKVNLFKFFIFIIFIKINKDWIWKKTQNNYNLNDVASIEDIINDLNTIKFDVRKFKSFNNNFFFLISRKEI